MKLCPTTELKKSLSKYSRSFATKGSTAEGNGLGKFCVGVSIQTDKKLCYPYGRP